MDLNKVMIIGRLTRDPEVRTTTKGQHVCTVGIATNRVFKDATGNKQDHAEFHNVVGWGKLAEIMGQYLVKGKRIYIEGRLQTREWQTQDGAKRSRTEIVAENMIMLDNKRQAASDADAPAIEEVAQSQETIEDIPF